MRASCTGSYDAGLWPQRPVVGHASVRAGVPGLAEQPDPSVDGRPVASQVIAAGAPPTHRAPSSRCRWPNVSIQASRCGPSSGSGWFSGWTPTSGSATPPTPPSGRDHSSVHRCGGPRRLRRSRPLRRLRQRGRRRAPSPRHAAGRHQSRSAGVGRRDRCGDHLAHRIVRTVSLSRALGHDHPWPERWHRVSHGAAVRRRQARPAASLDRARARPSMGVSPAAMAAVTATATSRGALPVCLGNRWPTLRSYIAANAHQVATPADFADTFAEVPQLLDLLTEAGALPNDR